VTFHSPLPPIRPLGTGDGAVYELTEPLRWREPDGTEGVVEAGHRTDLASVPAPFRALAPVAGLHTPAAIRHDRRCDDLNAWYRAWQAAGMPVDGPLLDHLPPAPHLDSRAADREFYEGIRQLDPRRPLRALALWAGVRLGAIGNPARRHGIVADLVPLLAVVLLVLPLYLPVGLVTLVAQVLDHAAQRVACLVVAAGRRLRHRDPVLA